MFSLDTLFSITPAPCPSTVDSSYLYHKESTTEVDTEFTLAIIKPEAYKHAAIIENIVAHEGFIVIKKRIIHLTPEQACEFYSHHYGKTGFAKIVLSLSDGPIVALALSRENAISHWKKLLGPPNMAEAKLYPSCLRSHFGDLELLRNGLHGSDSLESAEKEIHFFFPEIRMQPLNKIDDRITYLNDLLNPTLLKGLVELCIHKPADPIMWLADWLLENNPYKPSMHIQLLQIPT